MVQFNMEVASNQTVPFWRTSTKNYSEWLNETENESLSITSHPYHMMLNHVWTTAFSIMVIIGMFGNGSVLWIILGELRFFNQLLSVNTFVVHLVIYIIWANSWGKKILNYFLVYLEGSKIWTFEDGKSCIEC